MINLAGNQKADEKILEELYLANVQPIQVDKNTGEVPYSYIGKIGQWTLKRAWTYWMASTEHVQLGLPISDAIELHNKKHPVESDTTMGEVIRCGGHCGCPSPDEYGAQPVYNKEFEEKLVALGYENKYNEILKKSFVSITVGEVSKLCNEGKLDVERYVDSYHIDSQIELNEFVKAINKFELKKNLKSIGQEIRTTRLP